MAASRSVTESIPPAKTEESRATIAGQPASRGDLVLVDLQRQEARATGQTWVTSPSTTTGVKYKPSSLPAWKRETGPDPSVADMRRHLLLSSRPSTAAAASLPDHPSRWADVPNGNQPEFASMHSTSASASSPPGITQARVPPTASSLEMHSPGSPRGPPSSAPAFGSPEKGDRVSIRLSQALGTLKSPPAPRMSKW